jgi:hypothetical protein
MSVKLGRTAKRWALVLVLLNGVLLVLIAWTVMGSGGPKITASPNREPPTASSDEDRPVDPIKPRPSSSAPLVPERNRVRPEIPVPPPQEPRLVAPPVAEESTRDEFAKVGPGIANGVRKMIVRVVHDTDGGRAARD